MDSEGGKPACEIYHILQCQFFFKKIIPQDFIELQNKQKSKTFNSDNLNDVKHP